MRKILHLPTLALLGSLFCSLPLAAQGDYPVSFDKNTDRTHASRMLNSITLNGNTFNVKNNKKMYHDLTDCTFRAHAYTSPSPPFPIFFDLTGVRNGTATLNGVCLILLGDSGKKP